MSGSNNGSAGGRARAIPPPPPKRALDALEKRVVELPEAQAGVFAGARGAGQSTIPPPTRNDLPTLAPPRRRGETKKVESIRPEIQAEEIDILLDLLETETDGRKQSSRPPATAALSAICMFGRFEVLGRIAFGGMAEIFLGRERTSVGAVRFLAIKRILAHVADEKQFVEMFLDEARLAIQLNHPNICHIYEFGELEGSYFIAMDWVNGVPLGKLIRKARQIGGVPVEIGVKVIATIGDALHYAHNARDALGRRMEIVHRDVSPHNIMVAYDGQVKLIDFGIAKATSQSSKTEAGMVKGKFSYMAPEQCLNKELDGRVDVFALGICLWETLAGEALYTRDNEFETMKAIIEDTPPLLSTKRQDIPPALDDIVRKALEKNRDLRYQSAGEMQSALEEWLANNQQFVNALKIANLMENLYDEEIRRGPLVDSTPFGQSFARRITSPTPASRPSFQAQGEARTAPSVTAPELRHPSKGRGALFAVIGLLVVALAGVGAWQLLPGDPPPAADPIPIAEPTPTPAPTPEPTAEPTPAPVPVAPALGTLIINSTPSGGTVRVDGELVSGHTPMTMARMAVGTHHVVVERNGYRAWEGDIDVIEEEAATVEARLALIPREREPVAPPGRLSINTRPWSKVYVGRRLIGTTPIAEARVTSGRIRLRLVDRDGNTHTKTVRVPANGTERVFFNLAE